MTAPSIREGKEWYEENDEFWWTRAIGWQRMTAVCRELMSNVASVYEKIERIHEQDIRKFDRQAVVVLQQIRKVKSQNIQLAKEIIRIVRQYKAVEARLDQAEAGIKRGALALSDETFWEMRETARMRMDQLKVKVANEAMGLKMTRVKRGKRSFRCTHP